MYLTAIPVFAACFIFAAPDGFYAPYARYEPDAIQDRNQLAMTLQASIHRSFDARPEKEFVAGDWKLDTTSLRVDNIQADDGTKLSFRIRISAMGIGKMTGAQTSGWSINATISERPSFASMRGPGLMVTYRWVDVTKSNSHFDADDSELVNLVFGRSERETVKIAPALALNWQEESQFRKYLHGIRGDASAFSGHFLRMVYLSAVVITTLGLGDIVPISARARLLVAMEAITGVIFAGLFLNALAFRASQPQQRS